MGLPFTKGPSLSLAITFSLPFVKPFSFSLAIALSLPFAEPFSLLAIEAFSILQLKFSLFLFGIKVFFSSLVLNLSLSLALKLFVFSIVAHLGVRTLFLLSNLPLFGHHFFFLYVLDCILTMRLSFSPLLNLPLSGHHSFSLSPFYCNASWGCIFFSPLPNFPFFL